MSVHRGHGPETHTSLNTCKLECSAWFRIQTVTQDRDLFSTCAPRRSRSQGACEVMRSLPDSVSQSIVALVPFMPFLGQRVSPQTACLVECFRDLSQLHIPRAWAWRQTGWRQTAWRQTASSAVHPPDPQSQRIDRRSCATIPLALLVRFSAPGSCLGARLVLVVIRRTSLRQAAGIKRTRGSKRPALQFLSSGACVKERSSQRSGLHWHLTHSAA